MLATPQNRSKVFGVVQAHWRDYQAGIGSDTIAIRSGLDETTVEVCCLALVESGAFQIFRSTATHTTWAPVVIR